jgi:hypothetical protein
MGALLSPFGENTVISVGLSRLKYRGEIWRKVNQKTEDGGVSGVHVCIGNYPCDVEPIDKPSEGERGFAGISEYVLHLPCEADIRASDRFVVPGVVPAWEAEISYTQGRMVCPSAIFGDENGSLSVGDRRLYKCIVTGTSGAASPFAAQRPVAQGEMIVDGSAVWKEIARLTVLEIVDTRDASSEIEEGRIFRIRAKVVR